MQICLQTLYFSNEIGTKSIPSLDRLNSLLKGKSYTNLGPDEDLPVNMILNIMSILLIGNKID